MEIYFIIFISLFAFSVFDRFEPRDYSRFLFKFSLIFLMFFVGIRYNVGNDIDTYYQNYLGINTDGSTDSKELIYILFNVLFNFEFVIFLFSLLSFYFLYYGIKYFNYEYANTVLFIYFSIFLITFNIHIIRQGLAIAIVLLGYKYLFEKKYYKYILYVVLAAGFHISVLIVLPISYFFKYEIKKKVQLIVLAISIVLSLNIGLLTNLYYYIASNTPFLNKYLLVYRRDETTEYGFSLGMLFDIILLLFLMKISDKFTEKEKFLYRIFYISVILSLLLVMDPAALRLNYYFRVVLILLFPLLLQHFKIRLITYLAIFVACFLYMYKGFTTVGEYGRGDRNLYYRTIIGK